MICLFWRLQKGQVSTYLIGIIIILLVVIMMFVQIGKSRISKVYTANAADAGALAAATIVANGLSSLGAVSDNLFKEMLTFQVLALLQCWTNCGYVTAVLYGGFLASQWVQVYFAGRQGREVCKQAKEIAQQLAFANAGINDDGFGSWMEREGYKTSDRYNWDDVSGGKAYFKVEVDAPTDLGINPDWFFPIIILCKLVLLPCFPIPVPAIMAIEADNDEQPIRVTTTKDEPDADLGLYTIKYEAISSHGEAQAYGGSLKPTPLGGEDYDSRLMGSSW